jgi:triacylglycerol lipase
MRRVLAVLTACALFGTASSADAVRSAGFRMHEARQFDPLLAFEYGKLINFAYTMYGRVAPSRPYTPSYNGLSTKYIFVAWVRMSDFTPSEKIRPKFYGIIVQRKSDPSRFIIALRGTDNAVEWWDDAASILPVAVKTFPGKVGDGFVRIFDSMEVIDSDGRPTDEFGGGFVREVSAAIARRYLHHPTRLRASDEAVAENRVSVEVTGHSLGSALATLYVAANAADANLRILKIYTFASPLVGDAQFVGAFERLDIDSWRIADPFDVVTHLPFLGFEHVNTLERVDPRNWVNRSPSCLHLMDTYLYLIHPAYLLHRYCAWLPNVPGPNVGGHTI